MHDLKDQIRDYFDHNVERFDVESLPEMLPGADGANPSRHGASATAPMRRGWLIAAAAAVAVLLVLGGSTLLLGAFRTSAPVTGTPTTTQEVVTTTTPEAIVAPSEPAAVPDLSRITWRRVDVDENTIPRNMQADPDGGYISYEGSKLWRSDDGITWTVEEWPPEFEGFDRIEIKEVWALGWKGSTSQLFERVGDSWVPVQFGAASLPRTTGITWFPAAGFPIESGGVTVIGGSLFGRISLGYVYGTIEMDCGEPELCDAEPNVRWNAASETIRVEDPDTSASIAVLSMAVEGQTISFIDTDSGEIVHTVTGSADYPADVIADQLRRDSGITYGGGWIAARGSEPEWISFPWESATEVLAVPDGGFAAYEIVYDREGNPEAPIVRTTTWTSSDGRRWVDNGELPFRDASAEFIGVREGPTQIQASVFTGVDGNIPIVGGTWVSSDGVTWSQFESVYPLYLGEQKTDFGWVVADLLNGLQFWVSTDGVRWLEVEGPDISSVADTNISTFGAAGSILYAGGNNDMGQRTVWIGTFEPSP